MRFFQKAYQFFDRTINDNLLVTVVVIFGVFVVSWWDFLTGKSCESFTGFTVPCDINTILMELMFAIVITLCWLHIYSHQEEITLNAQTQIFIFLLCAWPIIFSYCILTLIPMLNLENVLSTVLFFSTTVSSGYVFFKRLYRQIGLE